MSHVRELLALNRDELNVTQRRRVDAHLATCGDCRGLQADLARSDRLLRVREHDLPVPDLDRRHRPRGSATPFALAGVGTLAVVVILVLGPVLGAMNERVAAPTHSGLPAPTERSTPSPAPSAPAGFAVHESPVLGYRIALPSAYRRTASSLSPGAPELIGRDTYTFLTAVEEREECRRGGGDIPPPASAAYIYVEAYRASTGTTAVGWASSQRPGVTGWTVEPATIDGRAAAKVVQRGATQLYVISANDRMYVVTPTMWPTPHLLDAIATTFQALTPEPLPPPTPTAVPRDAAATIGRALATAFASRDADAIAGLITPGCSIGVWSVVEPVQPGSESCCVLNSAVAPFVQALRDRMARGDLSVMVDPAVQVQTEGGRERYFVRSEWREPDRTIRIDLFLEDVDGQWRWVAAGHHYQRAELINGICIPYRSPWVSTTSSC